MNAKIFYPFLLIVILFTAVSCSKKEYAFFSAGSRGATAQAKTNQTLPEVASVKATLPTTTSTVTTFENVEIPQSLSNEVASTSSPKEVVAKVKSMSLIQKIKLAKAVKAEVKKAKEVQGAKATNGGKSQLIAFLLSLIFLFTGINGIQRFYLGYVGLGILSFLTLGGCGIWAIIDAIRILTGDLQPKDGPYATTL